MPETKGFTNLITDAYKQSGLDYTPTEDDIKNITNKYKGDHKGFLNDFYKSAGVNYQLTDDDFGKIATQYGITGAVEEMQPAEPKEGFFEETGFGRGLKTGTKQFLGDTFIGIEESSLKVNDAFKWFNDKVIKSDSFENWIAGQDERIKGNIEKTREWKLDAPEMQGGVGEFIGQLIPQTALFATAIMSRNPAIADAAVSSVGLSSLGSGLEAYDSYKEETGGEKDELEKWGTGVAYAMAEFIPERIGLGKIMPKGVTNKVVGRILGQNVDDVAKTGKEIIEELAKKQPTKIRKLLNDLGRASTIEASQEIVTELGQMATDQFLIDREIGAREFAERLAMAGVGGFTMGSMLAPFSNFSQRTVDKQRRDKMGFVTVAQDQDGATWEIVEDNGQLIGFSPSGQVNRNLDPAIKDNAVTLTTDSFNKLVEEARQAGNISDEMWRESQHENIAEGVTISASPYLNSQDGNLHMWYDTEGVEEGQIPTEYFILEETEDGMVIMMDREGNRRIEPAADISAEREMYTLDQVIQQQIEKFDTQNPAQEVTEGPDSFVLDGKNYTVQDVTPEGLWIVQEVDENLTPVGGAMQLTPEEQEAVLQQQMQDPDATPDARLVEVAGQQYNLQPTEDGAYEVQGVSSEQEANNTAAAFVESNDKIEAEVVRQGSGDPFTPDTYSVRIKEKEITPVAEETIEAQPAYTFKGEEVDRDYALGILEEAETAEDIEGLEVTADPEVEMKIAERFRPEAPVYTIAGAEVTKPRVKARIDMAKTPEKLQEVEVQGDEELKAELDTRLRELGAEAELTEAELEIASRIPENIAQSINDALTPELMEEYVNLIPEPDVTTEEITTEREPEEGLPKTEEIQAEPTEEITEKELEDFVKDSAIKETVYHGTDAAFERFDPSKSPLDKGLFFSIKKETAGIYGDRLIAAKLNIKNPLVVPSTIQGAYDLSDIKDTEYDAVINKGTGEIVVKRPDQILIEGEEDLSFEAFLEKQKPTEETTEKIEPDDKKDGTRVPGRKRKGETPEPARPEQEPGREEVKPSRAVQSIEQAEREVDTEPTEAQKEAGNYKKGHTRVQGFDITIENPKGSTRSGVDDKGKKWSQKMNNTYGYFKRTKGKDGDQIDVFLGENLESGKVFVVDQVIDGKFDEHKVMMGFDSIDQAREAYMDNYEKGWKGLGEITEVSTEEFKKWLGTGTRKLKPFAEYVGLKAEPSIGGEVTFEFKDGGIYMGEIIEETEDDKLKVRNKKGRVFTIERGDIIPESELDDDIRFKAEEEDNLTPDGDYRTFEEIKEEKLDELDEDLDGMIEDGAEQAIDYLDELNFNASTMSIEDLVRQAKGTTDFIELAGYVLQDGDLLDFSGGQGDRYEDHRQLGIPYKEKIQSPTEVMERFKNTTGAIRIDGDKGSIDMNRPPTNAQKSVLRKIIRKNIDDYNIDVSEGDRQIAIQNAPIEFAINKIDEFYEDKSIGAGVYKDVIRFKEGKESTIQQSKEQARKAKEEVTGKLLTDEDFDSPLEYAQYIQEQTQKNLEAVQEVADRISKQLNTPINVVATQGNLPRNIKRALQKAKKKKVFGVYNPADDSVYLVAKNIGNDMKLAAKTIFHEIVGHRGLRRLMGEDFLPMLDMVYEGMSKDKQKEYMDQYGDQRVAADEYLADMAEMDKKPSLWNRVIATIRKYFRKVFPNISMNRAEVEEVLQRSKKGLEKEGIDAIKPATVIDTSEKTALDPSNPDIRFKVEKVLPNKKQVNTTAEKFREFIQDNKLALKNWQQDVENLGIDIRDFENPYQKENLYHGKVLDKVNKFGDREGKQLINAVGNFIKGTNLDVRDVQHYLVAKHGPERNEYFWSLDENNIGKDFAGLTGLKEEVLKQTPDGVERIMIEAMPVNDFGRWYSQKIEGTAGAAKTKALWNSVRRATDYTLREWRNAGFISRQEMRDLQGRYNNYVPLRGWEQTDEFDYGNTVGQYSNPVKRAKGRTSLSDDPLSYIMNMANSAIVTGEKNRVKQALGNLVRNNLEDIKNLATFKPVYFVKTGEIDEDGNPVIIETVVRPEQEKFDQGLVTTQVPSKYRERKPSTQAKDFEVEFYENGQKLVVVMEGSDPAVARAIDGKEQSANIDMLNKAISNSIGKGTRYLSSVLTSMNPSFVLPNMMRDIPLAILSEYVHGDSKAAGTMFKNLKLAERAIRRDLRGKSNPENVEIDKRYQEFLANGGATGFVHLKSVDQFRKELLRDIKQINKEYNVGVLANKSFRTGVKYIEQLSEWSENISRFAVYLNHIEQGDTPEAAASAAKNSTVNFNRKGRLSPTLNGLFAFFNAAIQASDKYFKMWVANYKKMAGVHAILAVQGFASAMLLDMFGDEDEEGIRQYDKVSDYIKSNYLVIPIPYSDRVATIPMPHVLRAFHGIGVKAYDLMTNRKTPEDAILETITSIPQDVLPVDGSGFLTKDGDVSIKPFTPTFAKPILELMVNENFMGFPITPEPFTAAQKDMVADTERARKNVNKYAKQFTDKLYEMGGGDETGYKYVLEDGELRKVPALFDISPHSLEFLFESYTGGLGKFANNTFKTAGNIMEMGDKLADDVEFSEAIKEIDLNSVPVLRRFVRQSWGDPLKSKYYDAKRDYDRKVTIMRDHYNSERFDEYIKAQKDLGFEVESYKIYEGLIDKISDKHRQLLNVGKTEEAKKLDKQRRDLMRRVIELKK